MEDLFTQREEAFVRARITGLRLQRGVSEYKMSLELGHSKSYVQNISSGKGLPSLRELLYMCTYYFHITPMEFFDPQNKLPIQCRALFEKLMNLGEEDYTAATALVDRLHARKGGAK